ncbi:hypothetical protein BOX15_Mlig013433g1, partial [Macrostomum lignano]
LKYCFRHQIIYIKYRILWKDCQQNKMTQFEVQVDQYKADGNKAVCFKLVRSTKDLTNPEIDFHPDMCHQVFGDSETIFGYKNLSIKIYFAACSLTIYLAVEYAEKINKAISGGVEADDIMAALTKDLIPPGYLTNIDQFASRVSSDNEFKPFGVLKQAYTTEDDGRHFEIYQPTMDTPGFREFHSRLQIFLIFFVDAASFIDADDDRWSFLVLYEKFKDDSGEWRHAVAGYMTAYRYYAYPTGCDPASASSSSCRPTSAAATAVACWRHSTPSLWPTRPSWTSPLRIRSTRFNDCATLSTVAACYSRRRNYSLIQLR